MAALICKPCASACNSCCKCLDETFKKPFSSFVCCTGIINAIPAIIAVVGLTDADSAAQTSEPCELTRTFVIVDLLLFFYNIAFSVYIFKAMNKPYEGLDAAAANAAAGGGGGNGKLPDTSVANRAYNMIMWDPCMALSIILAIFQVIWQIVGLSWARGCVGDFPLIGGTAMICATVALIYVLSFGLIFLFFAGSESLKQDSNPCASCCNCQGGCCCSNLCCGNSQPQRQQQQPQQQQQQGGKGMFGITVNFGGKKGGK